MNKVLIVDDEKAIRFVLTEFLKDNDFLTIEASNGKEAIEVIKKQMPDAVLLDMKMGDMDGITTMKELKKINPDIPIIMITAFGDIPTAVDAIK